MKPILFASTATDFGNNGLGALVDSPRCIVREERNGPYELEMDYPVDGQHFAEIGHSAIIYAIPADGKGAQPFRIYEISKPFDGLCTIYAEHISYQLAHIPVTPFGKVTSVAAALQGLKNNAAESCPYTFWTDKASAGSFEVTEPKSIRELLGGTQGSILDAFGGGEYEWDKYTVKLHQHRGQDKGVVIKYGRNLTDLKQEEAIDTTITGIYPFWSDPESGTLVTLPEKVIHSDNAGNFPYNRTVVVDASSEFQDEPTVAQLQTFANNYITQTGVGVPKVSIDISFAPLWQTEEYRNIANLERVNLCDTVTVVFEKLGVSASAKVVKTEYDVLNERYETIELGDARTNLAKAVSSDISNNVNALAARIPTKNAIESIVDAQTALITGAMGGYIKIVYNAAGQPQELLFMDTDDIQTAVNVIRINKNGIGFSNDGYDPTRFVSAWTIDGKFSADFIATGHLLANFIQGGTLNMGGTDNGNGVIQVYDGNNNLIGSWDKDGLMASGNLRLLNGTIEGFIGPCKYPDYSQVEGSVNWRAANGFLVQRKENGITKSSHANILGLTNEWAVDYAQGTITEYKIIATGVSSAGAETDGVVYRKRYGTGYFELDSFKYGSATDPEISLYLGGSGIAIEAPNLARILAERTTFSDGYYDDKVILQKGGAILQVTKSSSTASVPIGKIGDATIQTASSSSRRYKHNIRPLSGDRNARKILDLPVVEFEWNNDHHLQYADMKGQVVPGIIAEDVEKIYPSAVIHDEAGRVESWDERRIIPAMLAVIQEQDKKIQELEARLRRIEEMLNE